MNVIFIGSPKTEKIMQEIVESGSIVNFAANTLQNALLEGFSKVCKKLKVICAWDSSPYPHVNRIYYAPSVYNTDTKSCSVNFVGAINLPVFNLFDRFLRVRKELKRSILKNEKNAVIIYEVHTPYLLAVATLHRRIDKVCLIVPDLPQYMSGKSGFWHKLAKNIDKTIIDICLRYIDSYALLSKPMAEKLPMKGKTWTLMEGIFQEEEHEEHVDKASEKVIMYTGNIYKRRGVDLLLDAFQTIEDTNYRLWIRGNGDLKEEIIERSKKDSRITYFEPMSMSELRKLERKATVMVNTTPPSMDFSRYFFPSKTMEYLASGTPTVMFRLGCMPSEYDSHVYYVDEESIEALRNKLIEVCEKPREELIEFGQSAKDFILKQKNPIAQCKKIIELL